MKLPLGFKLAAVNCGIKNKLDLALIYCQDLAKAIGFFTKSANVSYSVTISKKNINNPVKAVIVNSGNANCFSHKEGLKDTLDITNKIAKELKVKDKNILICSTGIIGKVLPKEKVINGIPLLMADLGQDIEKFAKAIMTTDTFPKMAYESINTNKGAINILGFAKGSGMICPDMATLLSYVLTDVVIEPKLFKKIAKEALDNSFNLLNIDGCMSTNDTLLFLSSNKILLPKNKEKEFADKLFQVCLNLTKMLAKDGEGATKFVTLVIKGAKTETEARKAGLFISNSNLLKCALYGKDANWGRIIAALGHGGIKVDERIEIKATSLEEKDITITIDLKRGKASKEFYTCDLTPEYVAINADYN